MDNNSDLKVATTSRAAIDSISNAKDEFSALIAKIDKEVGDNSQAVRISNNVANSSQVGHINKLKLNRRWLHDMLMKMESMKPETWEILRPEAQRIYDEAAIAMQ